MSNEKELERLRGDDNLLGVLIENAVLKRLNCLAKERRELTAKAFEPGMRREVVNGQGVKMGTVGMSRPNQRVVPDDPSVFLGAAIEDNLEVIEALPDNDTPEAVEIIDIITKAGREDLLVLTVSREDRELMIAERTEQWGIDGKVPTGWHVEEASTPRFTVTPGRTKPAKAALDHVLGEVQEAFGINISGQLPEGAKEIEG